MKNNAAESPHFFRKREVLVSSQFINRSRCREQNAMLSKILILLVLFVCCASQTVSSTTAAPTNAPSNGTGIIIDDILLAEISLGVILLTTLFVSILLYCCYADRQQVGAGLATMVAFAMFTAFLSVFLVPLDVYFVSDSNNSLSITTVSDATGMLRVSYYVLLTIVFANTFIFLPFSYIYQSIDEPQKKCGCAFGLTFAIVALIGGLVTVTFLIYNPDRVWDTFDQSIIEALNDFDTWNQFFSSMIGVAAVIGIIIWDVYMGYGLAKFPHSIFKDKKVQPLATLEMKTSDKTAYKKIIKKIQKCTEEIEAINKKSQIAGKLTKEDKENIKKLTKALNKFQAEKTKEEKNAGFRAALSETPSEGPPVIGGGSINAETPIEKPSCGDRCLTLCSPCRKFIAVIFYILSWIIVSSMAIVTVEKFTESFCGQSCAYILDDPTLFNLMDQWFLWCHRWFPADVFIYTFVLMYMMVCALYAIPTLGIRCLACAAIPIRRKETTPSGIVSISIDTMHCIFSYHFI
jgi:hypothetical protein